MFEGFVWSHSSFWVPVQALDNKVGEVKVFITNHVLERFAVWFPELSSRILEHDWLKFLSVLVLVEELHLSLRLF